MILDRYRKSIVFTIERRRGIAASVAILSTLEIRRTIMWEKCFALSPAAEKAEVGRDPGKANACPK